MWSSNRCIPVKGLALIICSELWVPSCPTSALLLGGHLSYWWALLGMAQLRDEQSSWIGPI